MTADDGDVDILRVPSPPQRRLSRSSIDLRDLEQQQLQPHDRVVHTDSAPSMIALENFYLKTGNQNKSESFFQPLISKTNFLNKPLECFHTRLNNKKPNVIDSLTIVNSIESDNEDLARFIEDNYQYFRKQNETTDLSSASSAAVMGITNNATCRNLQLQACSDPDFLTLKNNIDCCDSCGVNAISCEKKIKSKKHKMSALSDSDFIVSFGNKSKKFTLKPKIPFKTILNGKFPKANKYNALDHQTTAHFLSSTATAVTTPAPSSAAAASTTIIATNVTAANPIASSSALMTANLQHDIAQTNKKYSHKGLNNHLSQSLNGCYLSKKNDQATQSKSIQRVLSEGNETAHITNTTTTTIEHPRQSNYQRQSAQRFHQSHDAFDMFVKLFQCEKNNKNMCDRQSMTNKFNYKIVVNSKEYDYRDRILSNYSPNSNANANAITIAAAMPSQSAIIHSDSLEKSSRTSMDIDGAKTRPEMSVVETMSRCDTSVDQLVLVNHPYEENLLFNINSEALHTGHVLVNNLVITSPPVTPKQLLSPKTINKEQTANSPQNYFSYSQNHLSPHMLNAADTTSMSMELVTNKSPLEQLVSLRTEPDIISESKIADIGIVNGRSASSTTLNNGNAAEQNFIKNDLALINSKSKCDKNNSCAMGSARIRKPSVTYDINVINKSQDFNIDDICPQRSSYAARSGSTTSTSKCASNVNSCFVFLVLNFCMH